MSKVHGEHPVNHSLNSLVPLLLATSEIISNSGIASLVGKFSNTIESELDRSAQSGR